MGFLEPFLALLYCAAVFAVLWGEGADWRQQALSVRERHGGACEQVSVAVLCKGFGSAYRRSKLRDGSGARSELLLILCLPLVIGGGDCFFLLVYVGGLRMRVSLRTVLQLL